MCLLAAVLAQLLDTSGQVGHAARPLAVTVIRKIGESVEVDVTSKAATAWLPSARLAHPSLMSTQTQLSRHAGIELLDTVDSLFEANDAATGMRRLFVGLDRLRATCSRESWLHFAREEAIRHPLCAKLHEDPMVRRSFEKPRGYAGDAVLLDYLYGLRSREHASPLGRLVAELSAGRGPAAAVRHRRDLIAYRIDQLAERSRHSPRVLSVACGHFREGACSIAVQNGALEELVALDADAESLREVEATTARRLVTTSNLSVRSLLTGKSDLGTFDLVYSAGLYDYLEDRVAIALTARLFAMLRPGGRLLFCNFLPDTPDVGYMESFMGWELIYRSLGRTAGLAAGIERTAMGKIERYRDAYGSVGYVELTRKP